MLPVTDTTWCCGRGEDAISSTAARTLRPLPTPITSGASVSTSRSIQVAPAIASAGRLGWAGATGSAGTTSQKRRPWRRAMRSPSSMQAAIGWSMRTLTMPSCAAKASRRCAAMRETLSRRAISSWVRPET